MMPTLRKPLRIESFACIKTGVWTYTTDKKSMTYVTGKYFPIPICCLCFAYLLIPFRRYCLHTGEHKRFVFNSSFAGTVFHQLALSLSRLAANSSSLRTPNIVVLTSVYWHTPGHTSGKRKLGELNPRFVLTFYRIECVIHKPFIEKLFPVVVHCVSDFQDDTEPIKISLIYELENSDL